MVSAVFHSPLSAEAEARAIKREAAHADYHEGHQAQNTLKVSCYD